MSSVSIRAVRQGRHRQNAWTRHVVVSCRDVTWRAKWNLGFRYRYDDAEFCILCRPKPTLGTVNMRWSFFARLPVLGSWTSRWIYQNVCDQWRIPKFWRGRQRRRKCSQWTIRMLYGKRRLAEKKLLRWMGTTRCFPPPFNLPQRCRVASATIDNRPIRFTFLVLIRSITALPLAPNYTAWWERHVCVWERIGQGRTWKCSGWDLNPRPLD